jgi:hypothetical protein
LDAALIRGRFQETLDATRFLGIGNPSESGVHLLYYYRQENQLKKKYFITAHEIFSIENGKRVLRYPGVTRYVFIDDFCGSGSQGKRYSKDILAELKALSPGCVECRNEPVSMLFPFCAAYNRKTTDGLTRIWRYTIELPPFPGAAT